MKQIIQLLSLLTLCGVLGIGVAVPQLDTEDYEATYVEETIVEDLPVQKLEKVEQKETEEVIDIYELLKNPKEVKSTFKPTEVNLDADLQEYIFNISAGYEIDPYIVLAMIERESSCDASAIGDNGKSYGLMQVQVKWHKERLESFLMEKEDLLDPYDNVLIGIDYLRELFNMHGTTEFMLMGYNGGPSYARRLTSEGRVSTYAQEVMKRAEELKNKQEDNYGKK